MVNEKRGLNESFYPTYQIQEILLLYNVTRRHNRQLIVKFVFLIYSKNIHRKNAIKSFFGRSQQDAFAKTKTLQQLMMDEQCKNSFFI